MIVINWPLSILTDSPEFPRKLTVAGMVRMCGNETKVAYKRFMEIGELVYKGPAPFKYILAVQTWSTEVTKLRPSLADSLRDLLVQIKIQDHEPGLIFVTPELF